MQTSSKPTTGRKAEPPPARKTPARPSTRWRAWSDEDDDRKPDAGFLDHLDALLDLFEARVAQATTSDTDSRCFEHVKTAVEHLVLGLNDLNEGEEYIETGEREDLLEYIDDVIAYAGVDVDALNAASGRCCLADEWRDW